MSIDFAPDVPARPPLVDLLERERAAVAAGRATACAASCACHGGIVCARAEHAHEAGAEHPHAGYDAGGNLVQWAHTDQHGPVLSADQVAEQAAAARREHTRALLASLDLEELRLALEDHYATLTGDPAGGA